MKRLAGATGGALARMLVMVLAALALMAGSAVAAEDFEDIAVELSRAELARQISPNAISMDVTITDGTDGGPPPAKYGVFLTARQGDGEPVDEPENCQEENQNDPNIAAGVYRCAVFISGPGEWTFAATVNLPTETGQKFLADIETTLVIDDAIALVGEDAGYEYDVQGSALEVFLLWSHVSAAGIWLALASVLSFVAVPRLRRSISQVALQVLEVRRGFLTSALWIGFGVVVLTGTWLLNTATAYEAPLRFSSISFADLEKVTSLPYGKAYFWALYGKIAIFVGMGVACAVIVAEAARQSQAAQDGFGPDDEGDFDLWGSGVRFDEHGHVARDGGVRARSGASGPGSGSESGAVAQRSVAAVGVSARTLWLSVVALVGGAVSVGFCVTVLKYTHELIETARAATILGG
ncbi:MAG: hypothetical protein ACT4PP_02120 [Sporichthyaceae bacterium]